jgi:hypothetical protein
MPETLTEQPLVSPDRVSLDRIVAARDVIRGRLHHTPTVTSAFLSDRVGAPIHLKLELFQKTGSFKPRGVLNRLANLTDAERQRGLITLSAGNHAQAVAWAAREYGVKATVVMPVKATRAKVDATRGYGGDVVQTDGDLLATALELQRERNLTLVHPFDCPFVIAGQGHVRPGGGRAGPRRRNGARCGGRGRSDLRRRGRGEVGETSRACNRHRAGGRAGDDGEPATFGAGTPR